VLQGQKYPQKIVTTRIRKMEDHKKKWADEVKEDLKIMEISGC